jgi:hypothetical protein
MKLGSSGPTITPVASPKPKMEAVPLSSAVGGVLEDYLRRNPSQILLGGSLGLAAAKAGVTQGEPLMLGAKLNLHAFPYAFGAAGLMAGAGAQPGAVPTLTPAAALGLQPVPLPGSKVPSIVTVAKAASLVDAMRGPVEELAKTHPALDTPLDILGVVVASPQVWNALTKAGPKNKVELFFATAQATVSIAKVAADFVPVLQHAKPALVWTGLILKTGDQIHAIIEKDSVKATPAKTVRPRA